MAGGVANLKPAWSPGQSGNRSGKPGGWRGASREIKKLLGENCEKAIHGIVRLAFGQDTPPAVKLGALTELLNRGIGKPPTELELSVRPAAPALDLSRLSDEEIAHLERLTTKALPPATDEEVDLP